MKKLILSLALLCGFALATLAQKPSFNLGIKGGVNVSHLKTKDSWGDNYVTGYQIGAWSRLGVTGLYVQPELYLGSKGSEPALFMQDAPSINGGVAGNGSPKIKFTTLDLPVLLGTKIGPNKFNVHFMAGPVVSFLIDQKFNSRDIKEFKNQALGLQVGTGIDMGSLSVDLRYEAGLSNVNKSTGYTQKQNLFHLSLGFKVL